MDASKCEGTNREGGPCSATPQTGKAWCVWHDPSLVEQRKQWNRDAGRAKSNRARARKHLQETRDLREVDALLCASLTSVLAGRITPGVGTAAASIARAIIVVRSAHDLEARLAAIEAHLERRA